MTTEGICGTYTQEILQVDSSGTDLALDSSIFTAVESTNSYSLQFAGTADLSHANTYKMRLKAYYTNYSYSYVAIVDFLVQLSDPCLVVNLTIDNSILLDTTQISLTQIIGDTI